MENERFDYRLLKALKYATWFAWDKAPHRPCRWKNDQQKRPRYDPGFVFIYSILRECARDVTPRPVSGEFARAPEESPNTTLHDETGQKITNSVRKWPLYHQKSPLKLTVNQVCARYIGPDSVTRIKLKRNRLYIS